MPFAPPRSLSPSKVSAFRHCALAFRFSAIEHLPEETTAAMVRGTLVQTETPDGLRGRVSSVNMVFIGASNEVGQFESGITAEWFGTVPAVVFGGIGTMLVVLTWAWMFPALRKVDRLTGSSSDSGDATPHRPDRPRR